jgi:hypothetical protein
MRLPLVLLVTVVAAALAGCGGGGGSPAKISPVEQAKKGVPVLGQHGDEQPAGPALGFPVFATKNTTRVGGADPVADAAAVAQAVFPSRSSDTRPNAVVLVDQDDWRAGLAASELAAPPLRAPVLLVEGKNLPDATKSALDKLQPRGEKAAGGAHVIRIGAVASPSGLKGTQVATGSPAATARAIDRLQIAAAGRKHLAQNVIVASADKPDFAMPAAGYAAKSGDPVLWTSRDTLPAETKAAIQAHGKPHIYLLGPPSVISAKVEDQLKRLGTVKRVGAGDAVGNAIAFARFADGDFGWGVTDPGHGFVFASSGRTLDAAAAAPLSTSGTYGPLLLIPDAQALPSTVQDYLLDVQPGYDKNPVRGVYNHGWLMGDEAAISADVQSRIDTLLEIQPVNTGGD